jgi:hypothetical protein
MSAKSGGYTVGKDGKINFGGQQKSGGGSHSGSSAITPGQQMVLMMAVVCVGPALLKQVYDKYTTEQVDLSSFNIVTSYETPAIDMKDSTLRIQFCAS